jgi:hypothetical protein
VIVRLEIELAVRIRGRFLLLGNQRRLGRGTHHGDPFLSTIDIPSGAKLAPTHRNTVAVQQFSPDLKAAGAPSEDRTPESRGILDRVSGNTEAERSMPLGEPFLA